MQVMDIVNRAAMQSGAVPSFNPDEVPEDIQARGADILRHEIIPSINCDRSLDITEVVHPASPHCGVVDLVTTPLNYPREIYGTVPLTAQELNKTTTMTYMGNEYEIKPNIAQLLANMGKGRIKAAFNLKNSSYIPERKLGFSSNSINAPLEGGMR